jgi:hypothetical protein
MNVAVGVAELWLQAFILLRVLQRGDGRTRAVEEVTAVGSGGRRM